MKFEQFKKPRYYTAIGVAALGLAGGAVERADARPGDRPADSFKIYSGENTQYISYFADAGAETAYLDEDNIRQAMKDAKELADSNQDMTVTFTTPQGRYDLDFSIGRLVEWQQHNIHLVASRAAAAADATMGCQPVWGPTNPYESTELCDYGGSVETFMIPASDKVKSNMWPGADPDVLTMAKGACRNILDTNISLAQLNPLFGGLARGGQLLLVKDAARYIACESFSAALATKTAGIAYEKYADMAKDNVITGSFDGVNFKAAIPALPKSAWLRINSAQEAYSA